MAKNKQSRSQIYNLVILVPKKRKKTTKKTTIYEFSGKRNTQPNPKGDKVLMISDGEKRRKKNK